MPQPQPWRVGLRRRHGHRAVSAAAGRQSAPRIHGASEAPRLCTGAPNRCSFCWPAQQHRRQKLLPDPARPNRHSRGLHGEALPAEHARQAASAPPPLCWLACFRRADGREEPTQGTEHRPAARWHWMLASAWVLVGYPRGVGYQLGRCMPKLTTAIQPQLQASSIVSWRQLQGHRPRNVGNMRSEEVSWQLATLRIPARCSRWPKRPPSTQARQLGLLSHLNRRVQLLLQA